MNLIIRGLLIGPQSKIAEHLVTILKIFLLRLDLSSPYDRQQGFDGNNLRSNVLATFYQLW